MRAACGRAAGGGLRLRALADAALQLPPPQTRTKSAFDAIVMSRAAPGNAELLMKAYGNEVRPARPSLQRTPLTLTCLAPRAAWLSAAVPDAAAGGC